MAAEELTPAQREELAADYARHLRVKELVAALTKPTFRWRMANGLADSLDRVTGGRGQELTAVESAQRRSARTRRTNAERDIEDTVAAWWLKHADVGVGE